MGSLHGVPLVHVPPQHTHIPPILSCCTPPHHPHTLCCTSSPPAPPAPHAPLLCWLHQVQAPSLQQWERWQQEAAKIQLRKQMHVIWGNERMLGTPGDKAEPTSPHLRLKGGKGAFWGAAPVPMQTFKEELNALSAPCWWGHSPAAALGGGRFSGQLPKACSSFVRASGHWQHQRPSPRLLWGCLRERGWPEPLGSLVEDERHTLLAAPPKHWHRHSQLHFEGNISDWCKRPVNAWHWRTEVVLCLPLWGEKVLLRLPSLMMSTGFGCYCFQWAHYNRLFPSQMQNTDIRNYLTSINVLIII